jgi:prepilin-type N-terminal cleavage/methylation domain-containing protein/prepilin-type processing-associated H-X9-DG protein
MTLKRKNLCAFTLIELLVVVGIITILVAILLPAVARAKEYGRKVTCGSNLKQISIGLQNYAEEYNDLYPLAWMDQLWSYTYDDLSNPNLEQQKRMGWMRRLFPYVGNQDKVYKCPSFMRSPDPFNYFLGTRAAYAQRRLEGYDTPNSRVAVRRGWIEYPSVYVLGGDCNRIPFSSQDCDRDDYTQPCLGWKSRVDSDPAGTWWDPWHNDGLNVIFADTHVGWYTSHLPNLMTYSYKGYTTWEDALPSPPGDASHN